MTQTQSNRNCNGNSSQDTSNRFHAASAVDCAVVSAAVRLERGEPVGAAVE
jgi:hypothetical protein